MSSGRDSNCARRLPAGSATGEWEVASEAADVAGCMPERGKFEKRRCVKVFWMSRLIYWAVELTLVSTAFSGARRSGGFEINTRKIENDTARTVVDTYLGVGDWAVDIAISQFRKYISSKEVMTFELGMRNELEDDGAGRESRHLASV
ncbi:hypothetical protein HK101_005459 [Irineochytrium annulatum]|nr:hypothetical protein HK101_005459 [Irineochytrium annulatum]